MVIINPTPMTMPTATVTPTNSCTPTVTVSENANPLVEFTLRAASQFHAIFIRARCDYTPAATVTDDPSLFPSGLATFTVTTGANSVTVDSVNSGTGLQTFMVVNQTNAVVNIPPFMRGTSAPVTATYTITNPALPVDITLRATNQFTV